MTEYDEKSKKELFFMRRLEYNPIVGFVLCKPIRPADCIFNHDGEKKKSPRRLYNRLKGIVSNLKRGEIFGYRIVVDSPLLGLRRGVYSDDRGPSLTHLILELEEKYKLKREKPAGVKTA